MDECDQSIEQPQDLIRRRPLAFPYFAAAIALVLAIPVTVRGADVTPVEAKAIAEEGFIYGLPIVMNYAVMHEFAVDAKGSQFKAPFNILHNTNRVATPADTAVITPNSDTPYSMCWLDLRAEPMVISVPAVEKSRYYAVQLIDGNRFIQSIKLECLRKFILFGNRHLDHIASGFTHYYNTARCHMERDHLPPLREAPEEVLTLSRDRVVVESHVGGLFKSFERRAA